MDKEKAHNESHFLSQEDMEKYLKGDLSPAEQHRVEKILLEEGFEAEAMEGISGLGINTAKEDLDQLHAHLHKRMERGHGNRILKVAATVMLLALFSFGVYFLLNQQPEGNRISYNREIDFPEKESSYQAKSAEKSIKPEGRDFAGDTIPPKKLKKEDEREGTLLAYERSPEHKDEKASAAMQNAATARVSVDENKTVEKSVPAETVKGKGEAGPSRAGEDRVGAIAMVSEKSKAVEQPIAIEEKLLSDHSKQPEPAMIFSGKEKGIQQETTLDVSDEEMDFSADDLKENQNHAVEIDSGNNLKESADGKNLPVRPLIGMSAYKRYIKENMRYPEEGINKGIKGDVVVAFTVTATGEIKYLHIKKSLGSPFDKEAVRLIVEGPSWLPAVKNGRKTDKEVLVRIRFIPPGG